MTGDPTAAGERRFTVEEADALLAEVRPCVERLREARRTVVASAKRVARATASNGGGPETAAYRKAQRALRQETERLALLGVVLREAESGLLDFPSERDGSPVFLCWRLGEERVGWWHPPDTGFSGRQPL